MSDKSVQSTQPFASLGGAMSDSFELMRKAWGMAGMPTVPGTGPTAQFGASLPGALPQMMTPTLDVNEMDKRIADLKAVEQWLNLNMNMLRTTIQTLEVQRNTVATLQSYGGSMLETMMSAIPGARANPDRSASAAPPASRVTPTPAPVTPDPVTPPPTRMAAASEAPEQQASPAAAAAPAAPDMTLAMNPAAWWTTLQEQFAMIASAASSGTASGTAANNEPTAEPRKSARKRVRGDTEPE